ncbi:excinuclease ABC subunit A [Clostridium tetanomorphum]|uniref:UvrABC system protein A n=1 Tax=Clostridium tetanomorphum TaxID=1553 RepID=A0A923E5A3_CLOTT|nr:excinuclease ABC subunit UvrA [Clostridium tetanomorphum]KAJ49251.1 Excinuclease ABC subunit A [Clostridium tetanomorphum DSM 665]KAJ52725.1 Excinuclease ABC subunit A [Clostridium tetanomorphum DSM 665]MBC2396722.1 excinuclease ABC subunit UvrA [Clostridium tetanomorphum]MBP1863318.1 excinuclease ABC subunit A [Clostridium tetanomorphum]NRS84426.1 excinuclease ABC subunit A [Clostridium tetanomorphum]
MDNKNYYDFFPIGRVEIEDNKSKIVINKEYAKGLKFLSLFSHAIIIYSQKQKSNNPFSHNIIKIISIDEKAGIVSFNKSPYFLEGDFIYDIKPYFPCEDRVKDCSVPEIEQGKDRQIDKIKVKKEDERLLVPNGKVSSIGNIRKIKGEFFLQLYNNTEMYFERLSGYSHIRIFWWFNGFDKNKYRRITEGQPPYENAPRTGVFASRSPVRPNPIALTTARIINFDKKLGRIKVSNLDCFDNTPLIEIFPYIPAIDQIWDFKVPEWLSHWPQWLDDSIMDISGDEISLKPSSLETIKKYLKSDDKTINRENFFNYNKDKKVQHIKGIVVKGARQNNLKNIDVTIPYNKITVITGVSGSGKSSLAFDTIFAESQRRFMNSLSTADYSLWEQMEKPDVHMICGLPPSISISQKNISRNPRSTVGTLTDIYDFLRTLFASIGVRHCPNCGNAIIPLSAEEIVQILLKLTSNTDIEITPFHLNSPSYEYVLSERDSKEDDLLLYVKKSLEIGKGAIYVRINNKERILFQTTQMCYHCNHILFELTPSTFSFNNPESMCPVCNGLGVKMDIDPNLIVSRPHLSILDGASNFWKDLRKFRNKPNANWMKGEVLALAYEMKVDLEKPWNQLPKDFQRQVIWGSDGKEVTFTYENSNGRSGKITRPVEGAYNSLKRIFSENNGKSGERIVSEFISESACDCCHGERLSKEGRMVEILGTRFPQAASMTISELNKWVEELTNILSDSKLAIASSILKELHKRLQGYIKVGVSYVTLHRAVPTLSGGELQRLKLIKQLSSGITNMLYVLDEPSTGLHPKDHEKLINIIKELRDYGNTVIVVEHHIDTMLMADYIIDIGPKAGADGGRIVAEGTPLQIMKNHNSETGKYLSREKRVIIEKSMIFDKCNWIKLNGATCNNLKNVDISFPVGGITCVTGVSGSGKSSLVSKVLYSAIENRINGKKDISRYCNTLSGDEYINKIIHVNQSPIGRTSRSNPATYTGVMDEIRNIFAFTEESKRRGYKVSQFSFNSKEGQCEVCHGEGRVCTPVSFMPDIWTQCPVCNGKRYKKDILQVKYKDKNIYNVLQMNVAEALNFFTDTPKITQILNILCQVGLGYIKLGQSALSLSGGEAQRIKLAKELSKNSSGKTLYILDEPTTGLHFSDTQNLLILIEKIRNAGNSIVIIEHNLDVIKNSDWIIDLGPEGGDKGGYVIAQGTPEEVAKVKESYTGNLLKSVWN